MSGLVLADFYQRPGSLPPPKILLQVWRLLCQEGRVEAEGELPLAEVASAAGESTPSLNSLLRESEEGSHSDMQQREVEQQR